MENEKPPKARPAFYAHCYQELQVIAKEYGYNLLIHGSMNRDMDLVAVAWVDDPKPHSEILDAFCDALGTPKQRNYKLEPDYLFSILPGQRSSYVINLNRGGKFNGYIDDQFYIDVSFAPAPVVAQ